eukprot:SAG31_NODE_2227_length_6148_cov_5.268309_3_plen_100_part_00
MITLREPHRRPTPHRNGRLDAELLLAPSHRTHVAWVQVYYLLYWHIIYYIIHYIGRYFEKLRRFIGGNGWDNQHNNLLTIDEAFANFRATGGGIPMHGR